VEIKKGQKIAATPERIVKPREEGPVRAPGGGKKEERGRGKNLGGVGGRGEKGAAALAGWEKKVDAIGAQRRVGLESGNERTGSNGSASKTKGEV